MVRDTFGGAPSCEEVTASLGDLRAHLENSMAAGLAAAGK